ncbi:MAG: hypothetical protein QM831_21475 [Kofleriaceae bacterium]
MASRLSYLFATAVLSGTVAPVAAGPACPALTTTRGDFCFSGEQLMLTRFEVCGDTAMVCANGTSSEYCAAIDLAKGTYSRLSKPPAIAAPATQISVKGKEVQLCVGTRCTATDLPVSEDPYAVDLSADGSRAVVTTANALGHVVVLDATTGKRVREIALKRGEGDLYGPAYFVGDTILALVGRWPYYEYGWLVWPDGATRRIEGTTFGRGRPFALGGQRWAFPTYGGATVIVVNTDTGKLELSPAPPSSTPWCDRCFKLADDPSKAPRNVGMTGGGQLVMLNNFGAQLVDPKTLTVTKTIPLQGCTPPPR